MKLKLKNKSSARLTGMRMDKQAALDDRQAAIQKQAAHDHKMAMRAARAWLRSQMVIDSRLPLAINIHLEIFRVMPATISRSKMRVALSQHTQSPSYRASLVMGRPRFNLDGTENGAVI